MGNYDEIKEECYQANLLLPEFKLIDLTFGNVSSSLRYQTEWRGLQHYEG